MNDNYQSGKTQAIDLDELHVMSANRPSEMRVRGEFELDKWGDDPWASTEESRRARRWAEDEKWSGDDEEAKQRPEDAWDVDEEAMKAGWHAPKRGDQLVTNDGWDDWDNFGGAPKELDAEQESKEFGGYRRVQAASQYAQVDESNYVDGHAQRDDLYRQKEVFGTSGVRERKGDPYANIESAAAPMPEMKAVGTDWDDAVAASQAPVQPEQQASQEGEDMRASAKISTRNTMGDDIPGVSRASIIIYQADTESVVYELKKIKTSIGRGLDNMVILNDQYASRHHLSICYSNGRFELFALSHDNVTSVNGYPISHILLMNGDQIEIGATRIRFVLGPIDDSMLHMSAPINGKPCHLDPPPQEVRSPKTTRKNLILLIAAVGVLVVGLIVGLIILWATADTSPKSPQVAQVTQEAEDEAEERTAKPQVADIKEETEPEPEEKEEAPLVVLSQDDKDTIDAMVESFSTGTSRYRSGSAALYFDNEVSIKIATDPTGARIYNADGSLRGTTPYEVVAHAPKDHQEVLTIRLDGYLDKTLEISYAEQVNESLTLEPEKKAAPAPKKAVPAKPKPKPKKSNSQKKKNNRRPSSGGRILL